MLNDDPFDIINKNIYNFIQFLYTVFPDKDREYYVEIQSNVYNTGLKIIDGDIITHETINKIKKYPNLVYLNIYDIEFINNYFLEAIDIYPIYRSFISFHQNDDIVKNYLYKYMTDADDYFRPSDNLILIGGEMYGFHYLYKYKNLYCFSDFDSIIDDTYRNLNFDNKNILVQKIKYDTYILEKYSGSTTTICNNGHRGLGELAKYVYGETIYIVSCNRKTFIRDFNILSKNYYLNKEIIINNIILFQLKKI